jgi:dolichol kinase
LAALAVAVSGGGQGAAPIAAGPWLEWLQASLCGTLLALMALAASTRALGPGWERLPKKKRGGDEDDDTASARAQLSVVAERAATSPAPFSSVEVTYMAACAASAAMVMLPVASKVVGAGQATANPAAPSAVAAAEAALLAAVAGVPLATHAVMRLLSGCFSLGEGLALGQGLAAVLVGAAVQAPLAIRAFVPPSWQAAVAKGVAAVASSSSSSSSGAPPPPAWVFAAAAPAPATALPAFVVTLLAATLVLAACGAVLWPWMVRAAGLAAVEGGATGRRQPEVEEEESEDGKEEEEDQAAKTPARRRRRPAQQQEEKQKQPRRPPKKTRPQQQPPQPPPLPPLPLCLAALLLALAASVYVLLLARWTLETFVPAGGCRRVGILAYWVAVLGVSLPAMGFAARLRLRRRRSGGGGRGGRSSSPPLPLLLPRIVLRKGYHLVALALFLPAFYADLPLLCVALAIAFAALVATEGVRVGGAAVSSSSLAAAATTTGADNRPAAQFLARLLGRASAALQGFMGGFVDSRDAGGAVYVTHFTLLLGIALPIWLAACALPPAARAVRADGASLQALFPPRLLASPPADGETLSSSSSSWVSDALLGARQAAAGLCASAGLSASPLAATLPSLADLLAKQVQRQQGLAANATSSTATTTPPPLIATPLPVVLAGLAGATIIGVGDTAASAAGRLLGRIPVHSGSRKTVEGTAAGVLCTLLAWAPLVAMAGWEGTGGAGSAALAVVWRGLAAATLGAGLLEAATSQLDNLLIPLYYMPHLLLVVVAR